MLSDLPWSLRPFGAMTSELWLFFRPFGASLSEPLWFYDLTPSANAGGAPAPCKTGCQMEGRRLPFQRPELGSSRLAAEGEALRRFGASALRQLSASPERRGGLQASRAAAVAFDPDAHEAPRSQKGRRDPGRTGRTFRELRELGQLARSRRALVDQVKIQDTDDQSTAPSEEAICKAINESHTWTRTKARVLTITDSKQGRKKHLEARTNLRCPAKKLSISIARRPWRKSTHLLVVFYEF